MIPMRMRYEDRSPRFSTFLGAAGFGRRWGIHSLLLPLRPFHEIHSQVKGAGTEIEHEDVSRGRGDFDAGGVAPVAGHVGT